MSTTVQALNHVGGQKTKHLRPTVHITAPYWINDPCAPGYDANMKTHHLFYQCNPNDCAWADMHWGHVTSKDLLTWHRRSTEPVLKPDQDYDQAGVFTGCSIPQSIGIGSSEITVAYSSVRKLPFHWSTPPYPRNVAGIALASSKDGGRTWKKSATNPILQGEPEGVEVSGFRDPYVAEWLELDVVRGETKQNLYAIVSGGIHVVGPTSFLYEIDRNDPTRWRYLNPLVDLPLGFRPSRKWSGDFGVNWECTNFMTLANKETARHFLIVCPECDTERDHIKDHILPEAHPPRTMHQQLWMAGKLVQTRQGPRFQYEYGGFLDHGIYYAANSFFDPPSGRRIMHGWIPEEDCPVTRAREKGWNGAMGIPRELFLLSIPNVSGTLKSALEDVACVERVKDSHGTTTLHTLGVRPITEVEQWRNDCIAKDTRRTISLPQPQKEYAPLFIFSTPTWEIQATIRIKPNCQAVGFHLRHNNDLSQCCTVTFSVQDESITVDRSRSTTSTDINTCPESGPFTLFTTQNSSGELDIEKLELRIISDGDILEVFANDRFAMATMVYSNQYDKDFGGISAFATGLEQSAVFEEVTLWDGLNGMRSIIVEGVED